MKQPINILLQTTIPPTVDDWNISRFSMLANYLASLQDAAGNPLYSIVARDRDNNPDGNDPILSTLDRSDFDELWLFAVDIGDGLTSTECEAISRFWRRGGGLLVTRDHQDLGCSICNLETVGAAHFFQSKNPDPDPSRSCIDDIYTTSISFPNYHSGKNGDCQKITPILPIHPVLLNPNSPSGQIEFLPAHPHEGAVGVPSGEANCRVVAMGKSLVSGRHFNLMVAFEGETEGMGRAIAESTFHHFCDYNWDVTMGCPSFVEEEPGNTMQTNPQALNDLKAYLSNLALWLAPCEK
ncbi:MAG TPA: hypothetical protein VK211_19600 [Kamptonema sp.]|nr:hypothetical protein [Kamptonema sp.]